MLGKRRLTLVLIGAAVACAVSAANAQPILTEDFDTVDGTGGGTVLSGSGFNWVDNWDNGILGEYAFAGTAGNLQIGDISAYGDPTGGVSGTGAGVIEASGATFNMLDEDFDGVLGTGGGIFLLGDGTPDGFNYVTNWDDGISGEGAFGGTFGGAILTVGGNMEAQGVVGGGIGGSGAGQIDVYGVDITSGGWYAGLQWDVSAFPGAAALYNPGFEDNGGTLPPWEAWGNAYDVHYTDPPVVAAYDGEYVVKMWGNFWGSYNESGVWQDVPAVPGQTWELSGFVQHIGTDAIAGTQNYCDLRIEFRDATDGLIETHLLTVLDANSPTDTWIDTTTVGTLSATAPLNTAVARAVLVFVQPADGLFEGGAGIFDSIEFKAISGAPSVDLSSFSLTAEIMGVVDPNMGEALGNVQLRIEDSDGYRLALDDTATGAWDTIGGLLNTFQEQDPNGNPGTGFNVNSPGFTVVLAYIDEEITWGTGGQLNVENLLLSNTDPGDSDWYAGLEWSNLTTTEISPDNLTLSAEVMGDTSGGKYQLRVEGKVDVVSALNESFAGVTGTGGGFFIDPNDTPSGFQNLYVEIDNFDDGLTGEGAFGGVNNGQFFGAGSGVSAQGIGTGGTGAAEIHVNGASWATGGNWYGGLRWSGQGLASDDLSQVELKCKIRGEAVLGGSVGMVELRIEDAQGDRMYFTQMATGTWTEIGGYLNTATEGQAHSGGDGTFNLDSAEYTVVVSFIDEITTWVWGGTLQVDDLYLTEVNRQVEVGRITFEGTSNTAWQSIGDVLSAGVSTFPVEGGEFWGPGGENWGIFQWDAGLEDEEAFAGFWGNANPGNVAAQGYPGEGNGGGGAGGYEIANALATAGGWWAGVAWHEQAMDFDMLSRVELTADLKGTWDPNTQAPGTIYLKFESSPNNAIEFPLTADGNWHTVGGTLDTGNPVGTLVFNAPTLYSVVVSCYGDGPAQWGDNGGGKILIDNLHLKLDGATVFFEDFDTVQGPVSLLDQVDSYTVVVAFDEPVSSWGTGGKLSVDNLSFTAGSGPVPCLGDLNCDGEIGFGDINPFVDYLVDYATWEASNPGCDPKNGDINDDDDYPSFGDINPFVDILTGGGVPITCP